jgi:hypothetical protein
MGRVRSSDEGAPILTRGLRALTSRPAAFLLWLALLSLLVLDYWGLQLFHGSFDHDKAGTYGEWFSGILMAGAVAVALWANHITQEHYAADKLEEREHELTDLAVWTELGVDANDRQAWHILFRNGTGYPIYVWRVEIAAVGIVLKSEELGPIVPGDNRFQLETVPPGSAVLSLPCVLVFEDRSAQRWLVDGRGNRAREVERER